MKAACVDVKTVHQYVPEEHTGMAVIVDGSWMKRVCTSNFSEITITFDTGKVVDYQVSSKNCHSCELNSEKNKNNSSNKEWLRVT
jgi:hypothetical protein